VHIVLLSWQRYVTDYADYAGASSGTRLSADAVLGKVRNWCGQATMWQAARQPSYSSILIRLENKLMWHFPE
jgi:hypothetical protein